MSAMPDIQEAKR